MDVKSANSKVVLFPTDFSATSEAALPEAAALARDRGATLLILHVIEPIVSYGVGETCAMPQENTEVLSEMLHEIAPADKRVRFEHRLVMGTPVTEIVRVATENSAQLIVMGTHGRTGLSRLLMGSVAEGVVRRAPCPVLTYRGLLPQPAGTTSPASAGVS